MNAHFLLTVTLLFPALAPAQTAAEPVTRAVWVQQLSGDADPYAAGNVFRLMARELPSEPRVLLPGPGNYSRPLLSADGNTVYYTDRHASAGESGTTYSPEMFAVPFAGGEPRKLGTGMAVAVWRSKEGTEFVYALTTLQASRRPGLTGDLLVRFQPGKPDNRQIMWTETPLGADNFQLSRDGSRAAGLFPWPQAGLANMEDPIFTPLAQGSFPALSPDDSYALGVLDGDRRRFRVFVPGVDPGWDLLPAQALPQQAGQINHIRWTNDPLAITFSGPPVKGEAPDVYLAKLRPDLRSITQAIPLSTDPAPDFFPDVWVGGGYERSTTLTQRPAVVAATAASVWPVSQDALQFSWENVISPAGADVFTMHRYATPGRYGSLNLSAGWADVPATATQRLSDACSASGSFTLEALFNERRTLVPCSVRLLSLQTADGRDAFSLFRVDRSLVLRILTGGDGGKRPLIERHVLSQFSISDDVHFHLCLTVHAGKLQCYIDGKPLKEIDLDQPGLQAWKGVHLTAGDPEPYGSPWTGQVERIACYSRALAAAEVADVWRSTEALLTGRQLPTRYKVKARLLEMPPLPDAATLAASPRWLNASSWEIEQVLTGYIAQKKITVLQWAWLDGKPAPLPEIKPGQSTELSIESLDDHPEARTIKTNHAVKAGEQTVFFDTTPPGRHVQPFPP